MLRPTQRTEVTSNSADFLFKDLVVEPRLELSLTGRSCGNIHSSLTSTENNVVLLWGDGSTIERSIGDVCLQNLEIRGIDKLCGFVFRRGEEICSVIGPLD